MITRRDFLKVTAAGSVLASMGSVGEAMATMRTASPDEAFCQEGARQIPLLAEVDVVVVGGSSRAVAAATAAAREGCKVFLACDYPYLGEDICGAHLYDRQPEEALNTALAQRLFSDRKRPTPLQIKKGLEDELIDYGVDFLYSSIVTNVLVDALGRPTGVVIANRSGREAIRCKAIVDATWEARVAACMEAERTPFQPGAQTFYFTVVGNSPKQGGAIVGAEPWKEPRQVGGES